MNNYVLLLMISIIMSTTLLAKENNETNPLLKPYNTKFNVPPFDKIKPEHYVPAFKEAIKQHDLEILRIIENKQAPTFENTIEALEYSGELLSEVATVFFNLNSSNTSPELQKIAQETAPMLSEHGDNINLNEKLYKRVEAVYKQKSKLKLNSEKRQLLEDTYKNFIRGGAGLEESKKERFRQVNQELALQTLKYGENLLAETNDFKLVINNPDELVGLPQSIIDGAAKDGKWVFTLHNPSIMPFLQYCRNRTYRQKILNAYINRGNNNNKYDNKKVIEQIVNLRLERANLLGYKNHAEYVLEETMAKNNDKVMELLNKLWKPALNVAKKEAQDLQKMIDDEKGGFKLEPADWRYYAEKVRKAKYDLDEEQIRPYLKLENVREGIFTLTNKLYGIKFVPKNDVPTYHQEAEVYEVIDNKGSHLGLLYMDFYPRASKRGGAWMSNFREQHKKNGKNVPPIVTITCNFSRPTADAPALLTWDEAETFFHEFGHALHGLFSNCTYKSLAGTSVPRDFVELPSQFMENFVSEPDLLKLFARHYKTNEVIPDELINKIRKSSLFNQGFSTVEYLAAAMLDMCYYNLNTKFDGDVVSFENKQMEIIGLIPEIITRYRSTYFNHIFAGGYSAGYYSYIWSGVLDTDAFELFKQKGIFDKATASSFRKNILEKGKTEESMKLYKKFRGAEPSIEPLLKKRGLM